MAKIRSKYKQKFEEQQFKSAKLIGEQKLKDDNTKTEMRARILKQIDGDRARLEIETQDKLRSCLVYHEDVFRN
jgi:hypothetical protein